jgi:uncharacterized membrane protein
MFSIKESVKYGWEKLKDNMEIGILTTLLLLALGFIPGMGFFLSLAIFVFLIILRIGYTKIFLRIYDGETPKFVEIFEEYRIFWRYLGTSILSFFAILGGFILLIVPGVFWAIRFSFAPLIVVDTKMDPVASMKESYAITKGNFWKLFLFWVVIGLINLIGAIPFGIGLLVTVPVSTLASIYIYRELSKQKAGLTAQAGLTTSSPQTV